MYHIRIFSGKTFHYARTAETKEEAQRVAQKLREKGYLARIVPWQCYFEWKYQIYVYPEETSHITKIVAK